MAALSGARWRLVVPVALGVAVLTFLLALLLVYVRLNSLGAWAPPWLEGTVYGISWFESYMGTYALPALHFLFTFAGSAWVARRAGEWRVHGLLVGLLATFYGQIVMLILWPTASFGQILAGWGLLALPFARMAGYLAVGLASGLLGGVAASAALARQEAVVRTSREIGAARTPAEVTAAVGRHLAGRKITGIAIWGVTSLEEDADFDLLEAWPPGEKPGVARIPAQAERRERTPVVAKTSKLPDRGAWKEAGVRSALVLPLISPGDERIGLLTVASRRRLRPFSEGAVRRYSTVATQAALALENMRLVEEARRIGQEAGTLRERNRLAREIHDTLAQGFVSIVMNLEASDGAAGSEADRLRDEKIGRTARESLSEARRLVRALGPQLLENATLPEALESLARRFAREAGTRAEAVADGEPIPLSTGAEADLLRVAQEALHNVRKHAEAERVMLSLSYMGDRVVLDVRDDGRGFDPDEGAAGIEDGVSGGFGLTGMRDRIEERGGVLRVESAPGEGTTLTVEVPAEGISGIGPQAPENSEGLRAGV